MKQPIENLFTTSAILARIIKDLAVSVNGFSDTITVLLVELVVEPLLGIARQVAHIPQYA